MEEKKVSIIIPVYNERKEYLEECIRSLENQSYSNIEIIIIDDGSDEIAQKMIEVVSESDDRIKLLRKANEGVSAARNKGIELATGDYITFVDSDDKVDADIINRMMKNAIKYEADISGVLFYQFNDDGKRSLYKGPHLQIYDNENMWKYRAMMFNPRFLEGMYYPYCMCFWGKLFKKNIFENNNIRFNKKLKTSEDQMLMQQILSYDCKMVIEGEELYGYRINQSSLSHGYNPNYLKDRLEVIDELEKNIAFNNCNIRQAFEFYKVCSLIDIGKNYIANKNNHSSIKEKKEELNKVVNIINIKDNDYRKYLSYAQYIYLKCLEKKMYVLALVMAYIAAKIR